MERISGEDQEILDCMQKVVMELLERKRRLGQYAIIWEDGRPVRISGSEIQQIIDQHANNDFARQSHS